MCIFSSATQGMYTKNCSMLCEKCKGQTFPMWQVTSFTINIGKNTTTVTKGWLTVLELDCSSDKISCLEDGLMERQTLSFYSLHVFWCASIMTHTVYTACTDCVLSFQCKYVVCIDGYNTNLGCSLESQCSSYWANWTAHVEN